MRGMGLRQNESLSSVSGTTFERSLTDDRYLQFMIALLAAPDWTNLAVELILTAGGEAATGGLRKRHAILRNLRKS